MSRKLRSVETLPDVEAAMLLRFAGDGAGCRGGDGGGAVTDWSDGCLSLWQAGPARALQYVLVVVLADAATVLIRFNFSTRRIAARSAAAGFSLKLRLIHFEETDAVCVWA
jgi:hypothetical protein